MGSPNDHLPPALSYDTINALLTSFALPPPTSVDPLQVTAAFHSIYLVHFSASDADALRPARARNEDGSMTLVLRVSGDHIPRAKTLNEVAVMRWIKANCPGIPVPAVVRFDAGTGSAIGREFTLLERAPGRSVDKMYKDLGDEVKARLVEQLTDVLVELNGHEWHHVGGLSIDDEGSVVPGRVLEDTFWLAPDIEELWGDGESVDTLNPTGPYDSHAGLVQGYLEVFIYAIDKHPSLAWLGDINPRLEALVARLPSMPSLSTTRLVLAHKDLHFANIMATPSGDITAILDWEFAGVVPALRWDPVRAFLWSGEHSEAANGERERMRGLFEQALQRRDVERWWTNGGDEVESVWAVVRFARALVE
ncbi:Uncharacterized protein TCAP_00006, partial [Tolypocladium capitatum]